MINTRLCRQDFLLIIQQLKNLSDIEQVELILRQIKKLKMYIKEEYSYNKELPKVCHNMIGSLLIDINETEVWLNKLYLSLYYDLPIEAQYEKNTLTELSKVFLNKYLNKKKYFQNENFHVESNSFIQKYKKVFGTELVEKSTKEGLNILKNKKAKFFRLNTTLDKNIYNNSAISYSRNVVEKYMCQSLISNIIFETKNSNNTNTQKLIKFVNKLKRGEI